MCRLWRTKPGPLIPPGFKAAMVCGCWSSIRFPFSEVMGGWQGKQGYLQDTAQNCRQVDELEIVFWPKSRGIWQKTNPQCFVGKLQHYSHAASECSQWAESHKGVRLASSFGLYLPCLTFFQLPASPLNQVCSWYGVLLPPLYWGFIVLNRTALRADPAHLLVLELRKIRPSTMKLCFQICNS